MADMMSRQSESITHGDEKRRREKKKIIIIIVVVVAWSIGRPQGSLVTTNLKLFRMLSTLHAKEGGGSIPLYLFLRLSFFPRGSFPVLREYLPVHIHNERWDKRIVLIQQRQTREARSGRQPRLRHGDTYRTENMARTHKAHDGFTVGGQNIRT